MQCDEVGQFLGCVGLAQEHCVPAVDIGQDAGHFKAQLRGAAVRGEVQDFAFLVDVEEPVLAAHGLGGYRLGCYSVHGVAPFLPKGPDCPQR
jgi:hypothetical protein